MCPMIDLSFRLCGRVGATLAVVRPTIFHDNADSYLGVVYVPLYCCLLVHFVAPLVDLYWSVYVLNDKVLSLLFPVLSLFI